MSAYSQVQISGTIRAGDNGEKLAGVQVTIPGTAVGAYTNEKGFFTLDAPASPPFELRVVYLGYDTLDFTVESADKELDLELLPREVLLGEVKIVGQSIDEKEKTSPLTVESMGSIAIRQTPSADFYAALSNLKGVDQTSASLGFKIINTRGFNSTSPVRTLQIIDGVDNQAPGLNFSLGNFLGVSELDIQRVDLIQGASSAFYGPNAFNGVISMTTKDPFLHPGVTVQAKAGERALAELAFRYADYITDKNGDPKFAWKVNLFFLRADDWEARNMDPTPQSIVGADNPGGYDAVNRYGDENIGADASLRSALSPGEIYDNPGLGIIHRDGYEEIDVVDYDTRNSKIATSLHYKINPRVELLYGFNFGAGTTVYQGENRFSLRDILFFQNRLEAREKDKWFIRAYATNEDAGRSYDAVFTALQLQEQRKKGGPWTTDYYVYWGTQVTPKVRALPGFPQLSVGNPFDPDSALVIMAQNQDSINAWHQEARDYANAANPLSNSKDRLIPGTPEFQAAFDSITSRKLFSEGGTRFYDKSALYHLHGEYKFTPEFADIVVGGNGRMYTPNSDGTIFADTNGRKITNNEFGVYAGVEKRWIDDRLKVNATARVDKNQNFPFVFSPAASLVYKAHENHVFRLSFSSAVRNPTLTDQYLYYNVGRALLVGNIEGRDSLVDPETLFNFYSNRDAETLVWFDAPPIVPEKVKSIEAGYRAILGDVLYVDASYYFSRYRDFIGYKFGADIELDTVINWATVNQFYRISANADSAVTTQGFSIGANLYFKKYYQLNANYSWNVLRKGGTGDPIVPAFNTPEHKFNIGISGRDIKIDIGKIKIRNVGFAVNYKWVEGFRFEGSPQFTGDVPTYDLLDFQINKTVPKWHTTFKIGASNILNKMQIQVYGGPAIGRLAYFSVLVDLDNLSLQNSNK